MRSIILRSTLLLLFLICWTATGNALTAAYRNTRIPGEYPGKSGSLAEAAPHDKALDEEENPERMDSEDSHWGNVKALWR